MPDPAPWHAILPVPPQHSYHTRPPLSVRMRCAERYCLTEYATR